ncbi:MAG: TonB-dependent receptor [Candidatus Hydrogenedentes bacterium]|nr:TonB-dependent receptor [Candidatus Hydrogenedentota bacterium]
MRPGWGHSRKALTVLFGLGVALLILPHFAGAEDTPPAAPATESPEAAPPAETPAPESAAETPPATPEGQEAKPAKKWIRGSVQAGIDAAWDDDDTDVNLNQSLQLKMDPPQWPRLHLRGSLWMLEDLDSDESRHSTLRDINDASRSDLRARLLYLYVDVDDVWGDSTLRIGRQRIQESPAFNRIDGLYFKQRHPKWDWYTFGGARATIYDDALDDLVLGGGAAYRPVIGTEITLDAYYGEENRSRSDIVYRRPIVDLLRLDFPRRIRGDINDTLVALGIRQEITPNLRVFGRYTLEDGESDEILVNAYGRIPGWDLAFDVAYRQRLNVAGDRVTDISNFYRVLGNYEEYQNLLISLHRPLTKKLTLSLEGEVNNAENDDWLTANRDYQRYAAILSATDLVPSVDTSVSLERWDVDEGESTWAVTGEVTKRWDKLRLTVGTDYQRYKDKVLVYDPLPFWTSRGLAAIFPGFFLNTEPIIFFLDQTVVETHEDIYSVYTKLNWSVKDNQDVTARVSYETDDGPDSPYWRVQVGYDLRF